MSQQVNISNSTIIRVILIFLFFVLLYLIRDIVLIVFVSVIVAAALNGPVNWLQNHKVPRILGVTFVYLIFFLILGLALSLIIPIIAVQVRQLVNYFPEYAGKIGSGFQYFWGKYNIGANFQNILGQIESRLSQAASSIFTTTINIFGGFISAIVILFIAFYLSVQEKGIKTFLMSLIPVKRQSNIADLIEKIEKKIGGWMRGQILLMIIVGFLVFLGLYLLGVKYALTLALIAGILEIVPYIGPVVSAIPAIILSFIQSPILALLVIILYVIVQQLEAYVFTPQIMKRTVGLNPLVIILVIMIGFKIAGILGVVLSIPLTAAIVEAVRTCKKTPELAK